MSVERMNDLYWLAYLLTGNREKSVQAVVDSLDLADSSNPFFEGWMAGWSRQIFISKLLGACRPDVTVPELRRRLRQAQRGARPMPLTVDARPGRPELEAALLQIDLFPRRALLLTVFEKLPLKDAATLLNTDAESVIIARDLGLIELSRNLLQELSRAA